MNGYEKKSNNRLQGQSLTLYLQSPPQQFPTTEGLADHDTNPTPLKTLIARTSRFTCWRLSNRRSLPTTRR
jgi:hypothetical protein